MNPMLIIGIAGGSGSGKTTVADRLRQKFGPDVTVMRHDDYYRLQVGKTYEERAAVNYDCPEAFETELMVRHIEELKQGNSVECPVYDYTVHNRSSETKTIRPSRVLIIDGILILAEETLRRIMNIKIFVDTPDDIRILRRILRDVNERGRTLDSVINQYLSTVRPMHELYVAPSRKYADVIIPEGGLNDVAMDMLTSRIAEHLQKY
jgi:uridine kinase